MTLLAREGRVIQRKENHVGDPESSLWNGLAQFCFKTEVIYLNKPYYLNRISLALFIRHASLSHFTHT